jgi:hypothetical protein
VNIWTSQGVRLGTSRFLSTENDLKLTVVYVACLLLLVFAGEALAGERPAPGAPGGSQQSSSHNAPTVNYTDRTVLTQTGHTNEKQTSNVDFTINTSARSLKAKLTWTDDIGSNDDFKLALVLDGKELGSAEGKTGSLEADALPAANMTLSGTFTVEITCVSAPGLVSGSPVDRDGGNDWKLEVTGSVAE